MICRRWRPDDRISVVQVPSWLCEMFVWNVRYCDDPACEIVALSATTWPVRRTQIEPEAEVA